MRMAGFVDCFPMANPARQKGECFLTFDDFLKYREGLLAIVMPSTDLEKVRAILMRFERPVWLAAAMLYTGEDRRHLRALRNLAQETGRA